MVEPVLQNTEKMTLFLLISSPFGLSHWCSSYFVTLLLWMMGMKQFFFLILRILDLGRKVRGRDRLERETNERLWTFKSHIVWGVVRSNVRKWLGNISDLFGLGEEWGWTAGLEGESNLNLPLVLLQRERALSNFLTSSRSTF